jgi:chromo domain-containing protein 1
MPGRIIAEQTHLEGEDAISSQSEVEAILAEKTEDGRILYLISWAGYPEEKSTWEAESDMSKDILDQWEEKKKQQTENREEPFDVARF